MARGHLTCCLCLSPYLSLAPWLPPSLARSCPDTRPDSGNLRSLNPGGAAEKSGGLKVGDLFAAVNGKDVKALTDADVANLCRGAPGEPLTLSLCPKAEAPQQEKLYEAARLISSPSQLSVVARPFNPSVNEQV